MQEEEHDEDDSAKIGNMELQISRTLKIFNQFLDTIRRIVDV